MTKGTFNVGARIGILLAAIFVAMAGSYLAAVHEMQRRVNAPPRTYSVALTPFGRKLGLQLSVGQLGLGVILLLTCFLFVTVALALLAERRRREIEAANTSLRGEIVERKQAQEEVIQLNAGLEQKVEARTKALQASNKELEAFCFSVSHDLRAPLCAIDGFSAVLLKDYQDKLGEEGARYLNRVRGATQRMGQLIDDLLSLSRVTRTDMSYEAVDLTATAWDILTELQRMEPERSVQLSIADGLSANGDPRLIRQILENLLGNSWKYSSKQPVARIEMGARQGKDEKRAFFVKDNGAGFDMKYMNKLFGVFQRLHSASDFPGAGVGLAIVQRIIQRHGGEIWAEGCVGEGATFYFTL